MPDSDCPCEPLWISSPTALLNTTLHTNDLCESNNMNAFSRGFIMFSILGLVLFPLMGVASFGLVFLALLALYGRWLFEQVVVPQRTAYREAKKNENVLGAIPASMRKQLVFEPEQESSLLNENNIKGI